jgi:hypothetical protein
VLRAIALCCHPGLLGAAAVRPDDNRQPRLYACEAADQVAVGRELLIRLRRLACRNVCAEATTQARVRIGHQSAPPSLTERFGSRLRNTKRLDLQLCTL